MKRIIFLFIIFTPLLTTAKEYSFEAALNRAMQVDEAVLSAVKDVERDKAKKNSAAGLYFPKIGVKGQYTFIDEPIDIDLNPIRDVISGLHGGIPLPDFTTHVQDDKFFKAQAFASMPIFTGGKIRAANLSASASLLESTAKLENIKNNILVDVSNKYFSAMLAGEVVKVRKDFLDNAREHADNSAKLYKSGMISKVEKMSADITLSQAKRDYEAALNDAELAGNVLKNLLSEQEKITFSSKLFVLRRSDLEPLDYYKNMAVKNSPVLKVYDAKKKMTDAGVKAESSSFMPTVYLFGSRELYDKDLTLLDPEYAYGVGFEWSLFEGFSSANKTKAAKRQRESVELLREKQHKDINTAIEYYHKKIENAVFNYESVQKEITFAKEILNTRLLGFKVGTSTSLEVNVARTQLLKARLDSLSASYDCVSSLAALLNISGDAGSFEIYRDKATKKGIK
ncbi:Outer membrane protein TolC [Parelusimicrobium proximum]|uniref:TolC family protein n=1 Tax=Parelusimicrobium proximum TaxID=3228953 RepID=UPI003D1762A0